MQRLNTLVIDSTKAITDLCVLGAEFGTDKCPYYDGGFEGVHRHPYTAVYDLLFSTMRYSEIIFGELGILDNKSMQMWRSFFSMATLFGFDVFEDRIERARAHHLPRTYYGQADVTSRASMAHAFSLPGRLFDILIDDSTHQFDDQCLFIDVAIDYVKPGGLIIVEDVFRGWPNSRYEHAIAPFLRYFSAATMIETDHSEAFSLGSVEPYYNNDKLLVMYRNNEPRSYRHPQREINLRRLESHKRTLLRG